MQIALQIKKKTVSTLIGFWQVKSVRNNHDLIAPWNKAQHRKY